MKRDRSKVGASVTGYMDAVDWDHELGHAMHGSRVYPSIRDLKHGCKHDVSGCGIVKVKVVLERIVKHSNFKGRLAFKGRLVSANAGLQTVSK